MVEEKFDPLEDENSLDKPCKWWIDGVCWYIRGEWKWKGCGTKGIVNEATCQAINPDLVQFHPTFVENLKVERPKLTLIMGGLETPKDGVSG